MKTAFCTIVTEDYIHYALTLYSSLARFSPDISFKILITDPDTGVSGFETEYPNVELIYADELCKRGIAHALASRYRLKNMDCFRWSMKPVFVKYLLRSGYDQVLYLDSDLYFFADFEFLLKELHDHSVLLTPHWRASDPEVDEENFSVLQTSGLYNAGFVAASQSGIPAMDWWARACLHKCEKAPDKGLFVDQAYLDILPVYFKGVQILRHKGCNVANWNQSECRRTVAEDGKVKINNDEEIVFIHFTKSTIQGIRTGEDALLKPFLDEYIETLEKYRNKGISSKQTYSDVFQRRSHEPVQPVIEETRSNSEFLSPACDPTNIDRFIARNAILKAIKKQLPSFNGTLLDVGCGQMPYKTLLTSPPSGVSAYIGLDLEANPKYENNPDITWDKGKIPLANHSIDCAISTEVLEHCPAPDAILAEVFRVLRPGGLFFLTVPFMWPLHDAPFDEYRFTPYSLTRHLTNCGFSDIKLDALGGWDASLAQMLGLWARRRRMGKTKRAIISRMVFPIYKYLINKDRPPKQFRDQLMFTGLAGTCIKK